jgi:glycosyltransferase involved in cell wall biosynthesis
MPLISVIVTTYNWKDALAVSLSSLMAQRDREFEIVVADDGSPPDTAELIGHMARHAPVRITHCFHEKQGFRAAAIRNRAISRCQGDYLVFLDGDCLVLPHFLERHRRLASEGWFVAGNRVLMNQSLSQHLLAAERPLDCLSFGRLVGYRLQGKINRLVPFVHVPFYPLRRIRPGSWKRVRSCNLGVWKRDLVAVNGFDETFSGWGYEDSDLVIRLIHLGVKRKDGRFALPVLHLWHPESNRDREHVNYERFLARLKQAHFVRAQQGLAQNIPSVTGDCRMDG